MKTIAQLEADFRMAAALLVDVYGGEAQIVFASVTCYASGQISTVSDSGFVHVVEAPK